jgi:hypothetical protein
MSGREVLGAVAASLELVKVAKSCLSTFNDLRRVDIQEKEQKELQFHFIVQGLKFDRWCSHLGIQGMFDLSETDAKQWKRLNQVTAFEGVLQSQLRFKNRDLARLILSILKDINGKFSDAEVILAKYSETPPDAMVIAAAPASSKNKLSRGWNKFSRKSKEEPVPLGNVSAGDVSISKQSVGRQLYTGVHWVTSHKSTVTQLLEGVRNINHSLVELLQSTMQNQVSRQADLAVLDNVTHHTTGLAQSLPEGSDIRALARMRQWQVCEQKESDSDVSSTGSARSGTTLVDDTRAIRPNTYSPQDFKRNTLKIGDSRSLSVLNEESVVVEWKYYTKAHPFRIEQSFRLADLVKLLNQNELYRKFQALPCRGLVSDNENSRVGIVFTTGAPTTTKVKTLQDIIRSRPTPPPVGERFAMAERLALSIHNLHSVQWLHKGIYSDNARQHSVLTMLKTLTEMSQIICFEEPRGVKPKEALNRLDSTSEADIVEERPGKPSSLHLKVAPKPLPSLYLLGWDLSRPDHPSELSESISISTLGFLNRKEMIQMYTHPEAMASSSLSTKRARYRPQFDIYSLGVRRFLSLCFLVV